MTSVLIVGEDPEQRAALARDLASSSFEVHTAGSLDDAVAKLSGQSIDVLLTDLRIHSDLDGIELLKRASDVAGHTRAVMMSATATAQDYQAATQLGAVRVLWKPFTKQDLLGAIQEAVEARTGFRGNIHGLSLIDLLQMMHFARRSVMVSVRGATSGQIHLQDGEIIDAEGGGCVGEEGLRHLLASPSGAIHTSVLVPRPRVIKREFEPLLLDLLRQIDEKNEPEPESGFDLAFPVSSRRPNLVISPSSSAATPLSSAAVAVKRSLTAPSPPLTARNAIVVMPPNPSSTDITPPPPTSRPPQTAPAGSTEIRAPRSAPASRRTRSIDESCRDVVNKVDGAVACGVVDLESGSLLGIYCAEGLSEGPALEESIAVACVDLLKGPGLLRSERLMCAHRGIPDEGGPSFHEIHLASSHNYHFAKSVKKGKAGIMLITKKTTNVGMGWAMLRSVIPLVEPHIPG